MILITNIALRIMRGQPLLRRIKEIYEVLWGFKSGCCHKIFIGFEPSRKSVKILIKLMGFSGSHRVGIETK